MNKNSILVMTLCSLLLMAGCMLPKTQEELSIHDEALSVEQIDSYLQSLIACDSDSMSDISMVPEQSKISIDDAVVKICKTFLIAPNYDSAIIDAIDHDEVSDYALGYYVALDLLGVFPEGDDIWTVINSEMNNGWGEVSYKLLERILDCIICLKITEPGIHNISTEGGIILVSSSGVTLTGETNSSIVVSHALEGGYLSFDECICNGQISILASNCDLHFHNAKLAYPVRWVGREAYPFELWCEVINDVRVKTQFGDDNKTYLLLPTNVSFQQIALKSDKTIQIGSSISDQRMTLSGDSVDLTALFGDMESGINYPLSVFYNEEEYIVYLIKSESLPSLHLTLDDRNLAKNYSDALSFLHADKDNKIPGNLVLLLPDGSLITESIKQIKGRGNATWRRSGLKRPYNLKLEKKQELIQGAGKAKNWCLISNNQNERSGLANELSYRLFEEIGGNYAIASSPVDLYIDEEYRGTYLLTEKVEIHHERIDIKEATNECDTNLTTRVTAEAKDDYAIIAGIQEYQYASSAICKESGGFLLELDFRYEDEPSWFITRRGVQIVIKEPELATKSQVQKIAVYFQEFEDALYSETGFNSVGKEYTDYIDLESLVRIYVLDCYLSQLDMMLSSSFFYVDFDESCDFGLSKIVAGPAWDYDNLFYSDDYLFNPVKELVSKLVIDKYRTTNVWVSQLLTKGDFVKKLYSFSKEVLEPLVSENEKTVEYLYELQKQSSKMNEILWHNDFESSRDHFTSLLKERYLFWVNELFNDRLLYGAEIVSQGDGTLRIDYCGEAMIIQWYKVDPYDCTKSFPIVGATTDSFFPSEEGVYYAIVSGKNFAFSYYGGEKYGTITDDLVLGVFTNELITMHTNSITFTKQ